MVLDRFKCPPEALASLQKELDIYGDLRTLQGIVIPKLLAFGTLVNGAMAFLATSWEDGHELGEMESDKNLLIKVKAAYQKLHEAGVLHNDVARRNILVLKNQEIRIFTSTPPRRIPQSTKRWTRSIPLNGFSDGCKRMSHFVSASLAGFVLRYSVHFL